VYKESAWENLKLKENGEGLNLDGLMMMMMMTKIIQFNFSFIDVLVYKHKANCKPSTKYTKLTETNIEYTNTGLDFYRIRDPDSTNQRLRHSNGVIKGKT